MRTRSTASMRESVTERQHTGLILCYLRFKRTVTGLCSGHMDRKLVSLPFFNCFTASWVFGDLVLFSLGDGKSGTLPPHTTPPPPPLVQSFQDFWKAAPALEIKSMALTVYLLD